MWGPETTGQRAPGKVLHRRQRGPPSRMQRGPALRTAWCSSCLKRSKRWQSGLGHREGRTEGIPRDRRPVVGVAQASTLRVVHLKHTQSAVCQLHLQEAAAPGTARAGQISGARPQPKCPQAEVQDPVAPNKHLGFVIGLFLPQMWTFCRWDAESSRSGCA